MYITIDHEIEISDILYKLEDDEICKEYFKRVTGDIPSHINLIQKQNIDNVIQKMDKIDQFELEKFLNKY